MVDADLDHRADRFLHCKVTLLLPFSIPCSLERGWSWTCPGREGQPENAAATDPPSMKTIVPLRLPCPGPDSNLGPGTSRAPTDPGPTDPRPAGFHPQLQRGRLPTFPVSWRPSPARPWQFNHISFSIPYSLEGGGPYMGIFALP